MYCNNFFDDFADDASAISAELKDVSSELHDVQRKWKHKKKKGGNKKKLKKLDRKIRKLKKERKILKKQLEEYEYAAKHQAFNPWWVGTVEKSVPKLIDLASVVIQTRSRRQIRAGRQVTALPPARDYYA